MAPNRSCIVIIAISPSVGYSPELVHRICHRMSQAQTRLLALGLCPRKSNTMLQRETQSDYTKVVVSGGKTGCVLFCRSAAGASSLIFLPPIDNKNSNCRFSFAYTRPLVIVQQLGHSYSIFLQVCGNKSPPQRRGKKPSPSPVAAFVSAFSLS